MEMGVERCRRLFEKTGLVITAYGSDDNLITLEGVEWEFSVMCADSTPETLEDVRPASPDPVDKEHSPGSHGKNDDSDEGGGENNIGATMN